MNTRSALKLAPHPSTGTSTLNHVKAAQSVLPPAVMTVSLEWLQQPLALSLVYMIQIMISATNHVQQTSIMTLSLTFDEKIIALSEVYIYMLRN